MKPLPIILEGLLYQISDKFVPDVRAVVPESTAAVNLTIVALPRLENDTTD
jgi:hypothetical protein